MSRNFAFLSYSHKDKDWGDWLHTTLERYTIPRDLVGKQGAFGPIPRNLRPIFRDRVDMSAGNTVTDTVSHHLAESGALIVLCSPHAAASRYVNDEIRRFKASGRSKRIFPLIVGDPQPRAEDCFPRALTRVVDAQGHVTEEPDEPPLAADARRGKDGRDLAELKIIAGLIGVDLDVLRKREEIERRRRNRMYALTAAAMGLLAVAATAFGVLSYVYKERAEAAQATAEHRLDDAVETAYEFAVRTSALAEQRGIPNEDVIALLLTADRRLQHYREGVSADSPGGARLMQTLAAMNIAFARSYRTLEQTTNWWHLANTAHELMRELSARRPADIELRRGLASALMEVGETYRYNGDAGKARELHLAARDKFEAIRKQEGDNPRSMRDLSRIHHFLGELALADDRTEEARSAYEMAIELGRRVVDALPEDAEAVIAMSEAVVGLGNLHNSLGHYAEAVETYRQAASLRQRLIDKDRRNIKARRLLSWNFTAEAEALQELGRLRDAEAAIRRAMGLRNDIYIRDETNAQSRRDVGWSYWNLAEVLRLQGELEHAELAATEAMRRFKPQYDGPPETEAAQRLMGRAHWILGLIKLDQQKIGEAVSDLGRSVDLLRGALRRNGSSRSWQWDLAVALSDLGYAHFHAGAFERASACFAESENIHARLIAGSPMPPSAHLRSKKLLMERAAQLASRAGEVAATSTCE